MLAISVCSVVGSGSGQGTQPDRGCAGVAAALDVVDVEPLPQDHPLWTLPGVMITPHNSGDFIGWRDALVTLFAENFVRWAEGRPLDNVVDKSLGYVPTTGS